MLTFRLILFGCSNLLDKCLNLYNSGFFVIDISSKIFKFRLDWILLLFQPVENSNKSRFIGNGVGNVSILYCLYFSLILH